MAFWQELRVINYFDHRESKSFLLARVADLLARMVFQIEVEFVDGSGEFIVGLFYLWKSDILCLRYAVIAIIADCPAEVLILNRTI